MITNANLREVVTHTNSSGESAVSLKNSQETVQLYYAPAHEERMYNDVFTHSKRNLAFDFLDEVKLQPVLSRKQASIVACQLTRQKTDCGSVFLLMLKVSG